MAKFTNGVSVDMTESRRFHDLAMRTGSSPAGEDRVLEGLIFHALHGHEGDWSDDFDDGSGGDVWHRRDPEDSCAFDTPPRYLGVYEDALKALPEGTWISRMLQDGPGGAWICVLMGTDLSEDDSTGYGPDLYRAIVNASMLVRARS